MNTYPPRDVVDRIKAKYPRGTRIKLIRMDDPYTTIPPGTQGTVIAVDDIGTIHIQFDDGHSLGAVYGADEVQKI